MPDTSGIVRDFYDGNVASEWERLERHPFEFALTCRFLARYVAPGSRVLDVGGGPGRYSLHLAAQGCDVTLLDLSANAAAFARKEADRRGLRLRTVVGDAREADRLVDGPFDHVLLMGPLYHLQDEDGRRAAVEAAVRALRPGGTLFASFIGSFAGMIWAMKEEPDCLVRLTPDDERYLADVLADRGFTGKGFTEVHFVRPRDIRPFMERFPLETLHVLGQEGVTAPCEKALGALPPEAAAAWVDVSEALCEREDLWCFAEHLLYVGRRLPDGLGSASKAWDWSIVTDGVWGRPSEESHAYAARWKEAGFRDVLDFGCGLGRHALLFAKLGFRTSAFDLSSYGVGQLEERAEQEGLSVDARVADMNDLPYADGSFDALFAYHVISHTDTKGMARIAAEMRRVLRPGGELFATVCAKDTPSFAEGRYPRIDPCTVLKTDEGPEKDVPHFFADLDDVLRIFGAFDVLQVRHVDECWREGDRHRSAKYHVLARKPAGAEPERKNG